MSLHKCKSWLWHLAKEGWRPLAGHIGGLADVSNGKGEAKQMSSSVKREGALSCLLAGSIGGKSSLCGMDSQPRAELHPELGSDMNIAFHIYMYFPNLPVASVHSGQMQV